MKNHTVSRKGKNSLQPNTLKICVICCFGLLLISLTACSFLRFDSIRQGVNEPVSEGNDPPFIPTTQPSMPIIESRSRTEATPPEPTTQEPPTAEPASVCAFSMPQTGTPITPQPGDTALTWNPDLASQYPADNVCSDLELLEKWMAVEGLTYADLSERGCKQLVLVVAKSEDGISTRTVCYEQTVDGSWQGVPSLSDMHGWTGKNGIFHNRKRNTVTSPAGLWALGIAFGNAERPEDLKLPWRDVTPNSDWVCDAQSIYFNTWQERDDPNLTDTWRLDDIEHLVDYTEQYAYACVIAYNTPPYTIADRGCAIFLHCAEKYTGGCVGLSEKDMLNVLYWLDATKNPYILITGHQKYSDETSFI